MDALIIYLLMLLGTVNSYEVDPSYTENELFEYRAFKPVKNTNSLYLPFGKAPEYQLAYRNKNAKKYSVQFPIYILKPQNTMSSRSNLLSPEEKLIEFPNIPRSVPFWDSSGRDRGPYKDTHHNEGERQDSIRKSFQEYTSVLDIENDIASDTNAEEDDVVLISTGSPSQDNGNDGVEYQEDANLERGENLPDYYTEHHEVPMLEQQIELVSRTLKPKVKPSMHKETTPQQEWILNERLDDELLGSKTEVLDKLATDLAKQNYEVNSFEKSPLKWSEELKESNTIQMLPPVYINAVEIEQQEGEGHTHEEKEVIINPEMQIREASFEREGSNTSSVPQSVSEYFSKTGKKGKQLDIKIISPEAITKEISSGFIKSVAVKHTEDSPEISKEIPAEEVKEQETEKERNTLIPQVIDKAVPGQQKITSETHKIVFPRIITMKSAKHSTDADIKKESKFIPESSAESMRQFSSKRRQQIKSAGLSEAPLLHKVKILPKSSLNNSPCSIRTERTPGVRPGEVVNDLYYECSFLPYKIHQQLTSLKSARKYKMTGYRYKISKENDLLLNEQPKHSKIDSILKHVAKIFYQNIIKLLSDNAQKNMTDGQPIQILEEITSGKSLFSVNVMPQFEVPAAREKLRRKHGNNSGEIKRFIQAKKLRNLIKKFCDNHQKQSKDLLLKKFRIFCYPFQQFEFLKTEPTMSDLDNPSQRSELNSQSNQISGNFNKYLQPHAQPDVNMASQDILPTEETTEEQAAVLKSSKPLEIQNNVEPIYLPEHETLTAKKSDEMDVEESVRSFPSYSAPNEMKDENQDEALNHPVASEDQKSFENPSQPLIYIQKLPEKPPEIYSAAQERERSKEMKTKLLFKEMAKRLQSDMEFKKLGEILILLQGNGVRSFKMPAIYEVDKQNVYP